MKHNLNQQTRETFEQFSEIVDLKAAIDKDIENIERGEKIKIPSTSNKSYYLKTLWVIARFNVIL